MALEVATYVRAVRDCGAGTDCSLHHIAKTRLPYQTGGRLFSGTGREHESQSSDKQCEARGTLGWRATRKMLRMREETIATFC